MRMAIQATIVAIALALVWAELFRRRKPRLRVMDLAPFLFQLVSISAGGQISTQTLG